MGSLPPTRYPRVEHSCKDYLHLRKSGLPQNPGASLQNGGSAPFQSRALCRDPPRGGLSALAAAGFKVQGAHFCFRPEVKLLVLEGLPTWKLEGGVFINITLPRSSPEIPFSRGKKKVLRVFCHLARHLDPQTTHKKWGNEPTIILGILEGPW